MEKINKQARVTVRVGSDCGEREAAMSELISRSRKVEDEKRVEMGGVFGRGLDGKG